MQRLQAYRFELTPNGEQQRLNGGYLMAVLPHDTSQTCPCGGQVSKDNRQTQAQFAGVDCGFEANADLVGAINRLARGHRVLACEVSGAVRPPAAGTP